MIDIGRKNLASVPAVLTYLKSAEASGIDCVPLIARAGIDPEVLKDNCLQIPTTAMEYLLQLLIEASGDPCFGLHSAKFVEPSSYSVLGYISMNCSTLRAIQAKIPIFEKIVGDMGVTSVEVADGFALQRWECKFSNPLVARHEVEHVIGSWVIYAKNYLNFTPHDGIWFEHSAPADVKILADYQEIFGCEVLFDQPTSGIRISEEKLDLPLPQANEKLLSMLLEHATRLLSEINQHQCTTDQVKNLLRLMLKDRSPSSALIAEKLGISSRTLQRKLGEEGTRYQDVLNELRLELALYFLKNTALSLESIAFELGYAEARSFYRSFKTWTGHTAGSYRSVL